MFSAEEFKLLKSSKSKVSQEKLYQEYVSIATEMMIVACELIIETMEKKQ